MFNNVKGTVADPIQSLAQKLNEYMEIRVLYFALTVKPFKAYLSKKIICKKLVERSISGQFEKSDPEKLHMISRKNQ
jgi:hypothetical protein